MAQLVRSAVLGTGAWGTAFAAVLADAGGDVTLWGRDENVCMQIMGERRNERVLPGIHLPDSLKATPSIRRAVEGTDFVFLAVPSKVIRTVLGQIEGVISSKTVIVSLIKGIEANTRRRMTQIVSECLEMPDENIAVISGPNLAKEIAKHEPAATVVAAHTADVAQSIAAACGGPYLRPYTSTDVIGVELCGALKNVIALGVGMSLGLGYGHNTQAALISRGLAEMKRLGVALGAQAETFAGLAGMGDLVATCNAPLSRNRSVGMRLGQGMTLSKALKKTGGTAESLTTVLSVAQWAEELDIDMPIAQAVKSVLYDNVPPAEIGVRLLERPHCEDAY
jgi:glycerol-3-phosphate dehydrogenase (NAD(P)+)